MKKPNDDGVIPSGQKTGIQPSGGGPSAAPSRRSLLPMVAVGIGAVVLTAGAIGWWYLQPRQGRPDEVIERYAQLMAPARPLTDREIAEALAGGPAGKGQAGSPRRDHVKAAAMLTEPRIAWEKLPSGKMLDEVLAGLALRDENLAVVKIKPAWESGVQELHTTGTYTSPVYTLKDHSIFTLRDPVILVRSEGGKVRPVGLGKPPEQRELVDDEAAVHMFTPGNEKAMPAAPPVPVEPVTEEQAELWRADFALRQPRLKVVKVHGPASGRYKLETRGTVNIPPVKVREKDGQISNFAVALANPDVTVEVREGKIHGVKAE